MQKGGDHNDFRRKNCHDKNAKKITQDELAKRVGYKSRSSINKIEMGYQKLPIPKIKEFALALGVAPEFLMGWEEEKTPDDDELTELLEELRSRPDMRMLFSVTKDATPEDVLKAVKIIETIRGND